MAPEPEKEIMALPLKKLEAEALELSAAERAQLVHRLLLSLDGEAAEDQQEVERAWGQEIARRAAEVETGGVELIPAEQVFQELRSRRRE
jgi:putative addiction module component (TIGR02574 family)